MDILAGQPARPTTPVPGVWLVDAPATIQVRVYAVVTKFDPAAAASLADVSGAGSGTAPVTGGVGGDDGVTGDDAAPHPPLIPPPPGVLDRLRADPLERAWHALNARADEPALSLLSRPCAVVRPPADGRRRQLWVFGQDPDLALAGVDGLIEVERPAPIVVAKTVVCKVHGSKLSCLAAANGNTDPTSATGDDAKTPCSPTFAPPPAWSLLEAAAGEALAWTQGVRLSLLSERPVYDVTLRPTPGAQLVLCARPRAALHCLPREGVRPPLRAGVEPLVLRPLLLPALLVAPHMANGAQDARLSAAFDAALGPGWKAGRREARITAQASGASLPDWSIYFVPLVPGNIKALPAALAARWRGTHGVLTVWPTHLARALAPPSRVVAPRPPRRGGDALGQPADLLTSAAGLFDFFTAYEPPAEDEGDGEAEGDGDADADVEPEPEGAMLGDAGDVDMETYDDASDVDDLFESHSSPEPEAEDVPAPSEGGDLFTGSAFTSPRAGSALELDVNDLFGSSDADTAPPSAVPRHNSATPVPEFARRSIPASRQQSLAPMSRVTSEFGDDRPFVTEDDFNFFDSPPNPNPDLPVPPTGAETKSDFSPTEWADLGADVPDEAPGGYTVMADADKQGAPPNTTAAAEPIVVDDDVTAKSAEAPPDANVEARDTAPGDATAEPPRKRAKIYIDVVPPAFAPLDLPRRSRPRFRYGLPSPAAVSPLSLRTDLVERLQQQQQQSDKKASYDYTAGWELDSSTSDSDDDTPLTTGMPPTPASTADLDELPTRAPSVAPQPVVPDDEVEFDGTVCVGGEWVSLKDEPAAARSLARAWGPSWVELYHRHEMGITTPRPPDELPLDLDALLDAVVRNRFLRALFNDVPAIGDDDAPAPNTLLKHGVALSEFAAASITNSSNGLSGSGSDSPDIAKVGYTLPPTAVNVGFGGSIMSLSAAGLRYWRELGLSPAGGIKDLAAVAICEPGDENARVARAFLQDMGEVYSAHHLGEHTIGEDEVTVDGIVTTSSSALADTIARVRARATRPTVVYVITSATATARALAPLAARASSSSVVYAVPESAIHVTNLVPIAFEVYDLLPREVHRVMPRGRPLERAPAFLPYHAFTLSGDLTPRPELTMSWPPRSYDPFMRWRWVHAAYAWVPGVPPASRDGEAKPSPKDPKDSGGSTASGVLLLATIDEAGDALDLRALRLDACTAADRIERAWDVFSASATAVAFEWRLSITCLGVIPEDELAAWRTLLAKRKDPVTLLMTEPTPPPARARPRTPTSNIPPAAFVDPAAAIVDESLAGSAVALAHRVAVEIPTASNDSAPSTTLLPASSFLLSLAPPNGTGATTAPYHVLFHRGARGAPLDPTAFAGEMHALAALGRRRWGLDGPAHLDAVCVGAGVVRALARGGDERAEMVRAAVAVAPAMDVDDAGKDEADGGNEGKDGKDGEQGEEAKDGKQDGKTKGGAGGETGGKAGGKNGGGQAGAKGDKGESEQAKTPVKDEDKSPVKVKTKSGAE